MHQRREGRLSIDIARKFSANAQRKICPVCGGAVHNVSLILILFDAQITSKTEVEAEYNAEFLTKLLPRLDWPTMCAGADMVGSKNELPAELNEQHTSGADEAFLKKLHHILLEIDILEGHLECPETGRQFPISNGIPNMLLNEDEV